MSGWSRYAFGAAVWFYASTASAVELEALLDHQRRHIARMERVEATYIEVTRQFRDGESIENVFEHRFVRDGANVSASFVPLTEGERRLDKRILWITVGGEDRIFGGAEGRLLSFAKPPQRPTPHLLWPFEFAFNPSEGGGFTALARAETWERLAETGETKGTVEVDGTPCIVVEFRDPERTVGGAPRWYRVYFAVQYDYFPIQVKAYHGGRDPYLRLSRSFSNLVEVETSDGSVWIPLKSESTGWNPGGYLAFSISVTAERDGIRTGDGIDLAAFEP